MKTLFYIIYRIVSSIWLRLDRLTCWKELRFVVDHTPSELFSNRHFYSYTAFIFNQATIATLISVFNRAKKPRVLDFGCGLAPMAIACAKTCSEYVGVDIDETAIESCLKTYKDIRSCSFVLSKDGNDFYGHSNDMGFNFDTLGTFDIALSFSTFTHFRQSDAEHYIAGLKDVLISGGILIVSVLAKTNFLNSQQLFQFNHELGNGWFTSNPNCPETAIALTDEAIQRLTKGFSIVHRIHGEFTGGEGPGGQDILVLRKQ